MRICLDPGHSFGYDVVFGGDPGACNGEYKESVAALSIALKTGQILKEHAQTIFYTRTEGVAKFSLAERVKKANDCKPDCFVSIHLNSCDNPEVYGVETFRHSKGNDLSYVMAQFVQRNIVDTTGSKDRGVKEGDGLYVIKHTTCPAILVEVGFISNPDECKKLFDKKYQQDIALAIANGILDAKEYVDDLNG